MAGNHVILEERVLLEALLQINSMQGEPLVLFVVDRDGRMTGTLTDGDSRRALIGGATVEDRIERVMHRQFNFLRQGVNDDVKNIRHQKELSMKLIPVLDDNGHIVEIINLEKYKSKLPIDVVLMAGGRGERLRPLTDNIPKPLLEVGGKPIIDYNIDRLLSYGVKHISVTVNYLGEQIERHFRERKDEIKIETVREPVYLGTMGAVRLVDTIHNDTVLLMNSDLFTNIDYEDFYLHFKEHDTDMSVAAVPYSVSIPYGIFELNGRNIKGIREKPIYNYYANAGIYLIKRSLLDKIPGDEFYNATDFVKTLISDKMKVIRFPITGYWIDIGKQEEYRKAQELAKHL